MVLCSLQQPQSQTCESTPDKVVLVLIDGVGDVTIPAFGDATPLQVAHTPNLDAIAGTFVCVRAAKSQSGSATAAHGSNFAFHSSPTLHYVCFVAGQ
jgi:2,3-bisphosphoglycerate-independent phosphoglycerate mutase